MENKRDYNIYNKEISVRGFFDVIKSGIWIILVVTALSTLGGYLMNDNHVSLYQTETRIIIGSDSEYMKTLMVMIKDPIVMEEVKISLELSRSSENIANQVDVARIDESQVIKITVTDTDPSMAAAIANTTAAAFKDKVVDILEFDDVQLLSNAKENSYPINESQNRTIILLFAFGLIAGVSLVFVLDSLDESVKKDREIEAILGVPVLGTVTRIKVKKSNKIQEGKPKRQQIEIRGDIGELK